ncbi:hypothetical protein [Chitinibacter tainanensis]|uniref:hypothetical protein n=1 Tax=Chitinibacter tainanensis TaxID=230667 RepID=UPI002353CDEF|nr:hypothetical protein [Chitinibacter tainanensis]
MQEGGFEDKTAGRIEQVMARWNPDSNKLGVLGHVKVPTDRRRMDLVLYERSSVGQQLLSIDTIVELKTNYAGQKGEIQKRLALNGKGSAIEQVQKYQASSHPGSKDGYVLYTITELPFPAPKVTPCSPGFANAGTPLHAGVTTFMNAIRHNRLTLLGHATG